jgi:UDP-N-acetylmuramyl pentapeptide phosphotransferase/UDP-N-acetylglucosamine-1-phosphate transferase
MDNKLVISFLAALILGFFSIPGVVRVAIKKDLVAKPNHRTSHTGRIPMSAEYLSLYLLFWRS